MSSPRAAGWLRRHLAWSNSSRSWQERLGAAALIGAAILGWHLSRDWGIESRILLTALWLVFLAVLLRRGIVRLLGPVFFFELLRGSRKRIHLTRTLYAGLLLFALGYVHVVYTQFDSDYRGQTMQKQAEVASTFFVVFSTLQMAVAALLAPVAVAGAIAEEKERRTLEFILATDLRSREIVLGKLAARMANLVLILLAGLPVLSLLQFQGGIDPGLLLCGLAVVAMTLASTAAVSIWMSTMLRRGRDAIVMTYLAIAGYIVLSASARLLLFTSFGQRGVTILGRNYYGYELIDAIGAGNPFVALGGIVSQLFMATGAVMDVVPHLLKEYAIFHGLVVVAALAWSVVRLRPVALSQSAGGESKRKRRGRKLPALGRLPMVWKELFAEPGMRLHFLLRMMLAALMLLSFLPAVLITANHFERLMNPVEWQNSMAHWHIDSVWYYYGQNMNRWVRSMGGILGTLLLLAVAVRAAGAVSGERARRTLDELLTTPFTNGEIVNAKWLGSILGLRRAGLWLGAIFFIGLCSGGLNALGAILYTAAWFCYAGFMASLGLWFSTVCRSTARATTATILMALLALGGHWILSGLFCFLPMGQSFAYHEYREFSDWLTDSQLAVTPPYVLVRTSLHDLDNVNIHEPMRTIAYPIFGLLAFLVAGQLLRLNAIRQFGRVTGRTLLRAPELLPMKPTTESTPRRVAP